MGQKTNVAQRTLYDIRDGNSYRVRKLADGNCWMTENLRITGQKTLSSTDSDVLFTWSLPAQSTAWCGETSESCQNQAKNLYSNDVAYGTYYSWYAATAGTGSYSVTTEAVSSICPKGWRLPTGLDTGEFQNLFNQYNSTLLLQASPTSLIKSGFRSGQTNTNVLAGQVGYYWSKTTRWSGFGTGIYIDDSSVSIGGGLMASDGFPVRCIAR